MEPVIAHVSSDVLFHLRMVEHGLAAHFSRTWWCGRRAVCGAEIFGTIAAIQRFSSEAEAISRANATEFGLAGYVFTETRPRPQRRRPSRDRNRRHQPGVPSNAGAPFGGIKQSGLGREGSAEGLEEYENIRFYNVARRATA